MIRMLKKIWHVNDCDKIMITYILCSEIKESWEHSNIHNWNIVSINLWCVISYLKECCVMQVILNDFKNNIHSNEIIAQSSATK